MTFSSTVKLDIPLVKRRILELDLKKTWIAAKIGVTKSAFFDWLNGKVKKVKYANAKALAEILELSLEEITAERSLPPQPQGSEISEHGRRTSSINCILDYINIYLADLPAKHSLIHLISVNQFLEALELITAECEQLKEQPPANSTHLVVGHLYYLAMDYTRALRSYNRTLINNKTQPAIILRIGYLKGLLGYFDEARHFLSLYDDMYEDHRAKDLIVGDILFEQGLYAKGVELLEPWIESLPEGTTQTPIDTLAMLTQARSLLSSARLKEFHANLMRVEPDCNDPHSFGFATYLKGMEMVVLGQSAKAHALLKELLGHSLRNPALVDIKLAAKNRMMIAWLYFHGKEHQRAVDKAIEAGEVLKNTFKAHHFLHFEIEQVRIESLICLRKLTEARKRFEFFEQVGHNSFAHDHVKKSLANMILGKILQAEHKYSEAIEKFEAAKSHVRYEEKRKYIYWFVIQAHIAACKTHLGKYDEAEALYQGLLPDPRVDKTFSMYLAYFVSYAGMLAKRGDTGESLQLARTLYRRRMTDGHGDDIEIMLHYGKLWLNCGNPTKAMIFFKRAANLDGSSYEYQTVPFYVGLCQLLQKKFDEARLSFCQVERNFGKLQNIEPRLYLNISYMTGLIDTYLKAPRAALERFDHILESRFREQFDAVCFHHAYVYFFMGINNFMLDDRIDSQFYLKRFVHAGSQNCELFGSDVAYSKHLLSAIESETESNADQAEIPFQNLGLLEGYIHLDKALI